VTSWYFTFFLLYDEEKKRVGGGRRPSSGRPSDNISCERPKRSPDGEIFFSSQGAPAPCEEKKISPAQADRPSSAHPTDSNHAWDRNALPTARFFFPRRVSALWKKNRGGGGRRPSSGRPSDNISCERPRRSPDLYYFIFFTFL